MILIEHHVMVKVNNISRFFRDEIEIFSNLVVRDEIEICFFYISCFETRSRICFTTSRISRRGRETKQLILEVEREFSMLILARHFEIENSRQCLQYLTFSFKLFLLPGVSPTSHLPNHGSLPLGSRHRPRQCSNSLPDCPWRPPWWWTPCCCFCPPHPRWAGGGGRVLQQCQ